MQPSELHTWLTARWQEWADTAREATPGPWLADPTGTVVAANDLVDDMLPTQGPSEVAECYRNERGANVERAGNAAHIAAAAPDRIIAVCEAALRALQRHRPAGTWLEVACRSCADDETDVLWPCPEVLDLASVWATRGDCPEELRP